MIWNIFGDQQCQNCDALVVDERLTPSVEKAIATSKKVNEKIGSTTVRPNYGRIVINDKI